MKHFSLFAFVYKIIFAAANIICRGAAPADPAKGVPPFGTLLRALRGQDSATHGKNNFSDNISRDKGHSGLYFSHITELNV